MKKKKNFIILLIILIIILTSLTILKLISPELSSPNQNTLEKIFKDSGYVLQETYQKGEKIQEMTIKNTTYKFKKDEITIYVLEYPNSEKLKEEIPRFQNETFYKICEEEFCSYHLIFNQYYLSTDGEKEDEKKEIIKFFQQLDSYNK